MFFIKQMSDSLIPSFLVSDVSESLRSLTKNERCEQIAQVAHQKWAMWANRSGRSPKMSDVSESLRSLTKNERMSESLIFLSESLICSFLGKKQAIRSENWWANFQPCSEGILRNNNLIFPSVNKYCIVRSATKPY